MNSEGDFLSRGLLGFLGKPVRQDQQSPAFEKAQQPENVIAKLDTDFPDAFAVSQFLEILAGNYVQLFNQPQDP